MAALGLGGAAVAAWLARIAVGDTSLGGLLLPVALAVSAVAAAWLAREKAEHREGEWGRGLGLTALALCVLTLLAGGGTSTADTTEPATDTGVTQVDPRPGPPGGREFGRGPGR